MSGNVNMSKDADAVGLQDIAATGGVLEGSEETSDVEGQVLDWRTRIDTSIARSRKVRAGNYVQIATVDADGAPHCRTVVFRGFLAMDDGRGDGKEGLKMITDARSDKVAHIAHSARCELVWWFAKSSEQYRITGTLTLVGEEHPSAHLRSARKQQWGNLSDAAREQFFWPTPGAFYKGATEVVVVRPRAVRARVVCCFLLPHSLHHPVPISFPASLPYPLTQVPRGGRDEAGVLLSPPPAFMLMLLVPSSTKYLRLTDNYAQVDGDTGDGDGADNGTDCGVYARVSGEEGVEGVAGVDGRVPVATASWLPRRVNL